MTDKELTILAYTTMILSCVFFGCGFQFESLLALGVCAVLVAVCLASFTVLSKRKYGGGGPQGPIQPA